MHLLKPKMSKCAPSLLGKPLYPDIVASSGRGRSGGKQVCLVAHADQHNIGGESLVSLVRKPSA